MFLECGRDEQASKNDNDSDNDNAAEHHHDHYLTRFAYLNWWSACAVQTGRTGWRRRDSPTRPAPRVLLTNCRRGEFISNEHRVRGPAGRRNRAANFKDVSGEFSFIALDRNNNAPPAAITAAAAAPTITAARRQQRQQRQRRWHAPASSNPGPTVSRLDLVLGRVQRGRPANIQVNLCGRGAGRRAPLRRGRHRNGTGRAGTAAAQLKTTGRIGN
jgi:hypothetical protein